MLAIASNLKRRLLKDSVQWIASRKTFRQTLHQLGIRPLGHNTLLWFKESSDFHTRVVLRNYFSLNYKIPTPTYHFTLFDDHGTKVHEWNQKAQPDQTLIVESGDVVKRSGKGSSFEGSLAIEIQDKHLFPPRYLRANVDYYAPKNFITTVHDQGRLFSRTSADIQTLVCVMEDSSHETGIVLNNCYRYKASPQEFLAKARIELINSMGQCQSRETAALPACSNRLFWLKDLFPDIQSFLKGKPGGLRVYANIGMPRCVSIIKVKDKGYSVNHTVGDHDPSIYARSLLKADAVPQKDWAPVWMSFVKEDENFHSYFSFFNNWQPKDAYTLDVRIFDAQGKKIKEVPEALSLSPHETLVLSMQNFIKQHNIPTPFLGSIHARITPRKDKDTFPGPGMLQVNTIWENDGFLALSNNQSFWYCNVKSDIKHGMIQNRTRMFGRVVSNDQQETVLVLINPSSSMDYNTPSDTHLQVDLASGKGRLDKEITIPAQGCYMASFDELFPDIRNFLKESHGVSSMVVVDREVKLLGYLMLRDRATGAIGIDHLFGG